DGDVFVGARGEQVHPQLQQLGPSGIGLQPHAARPDLARARAQNPKAFCRCNSRSRSLVLIFPLMKSIGPGLWVPASILMNSSAEVLSTQSAVPILPCARSQLVSVRVTVHFSSGASPSDR